jgi:hypothetical protein
VTTKLKFVAALAILTLAALPALAQVSEFHFSDSAADYSDRYIVAVEADSAPILSLEGTPASGLVPVNVVMPHMAPELALRSFEAHARLQNADLASYSAVTEISAQLPDTAQKGDFELLRHYTAPNGLKFTAVRFTGDGFVKTNVITRLLQQEVDHVERGDGALTAISTANYKFSYKGSSAIDGRAMHVYQVKPRRQFAGLFRGHIYVDAVTGTLRRAEGTVVKSPSWFIKKIDFVQDYADVGGFTFPVRTHTVAMTRVVGRAVVDIFHRNYEPRAIPGSEDAVSSGVVTLPTSGVVLTSLEQN